MNIPRLSAATVLVAALSASVSAQSLAPSVPGFESTPDGWVLRQDGVVYPVDKRVVSARFADGATDVSARLDALAGVTPELAGLVVVRSNRLGVVDLGIPLGADPLDVVAALREHGDVDFAEPNTLGHYTAVPNDSSYGVQWNLKNTGQSGGTPGADVDAEGAWDIQDGDPSVVIAVLDSGTQWNHPDLASNIWENTDEAFDGTDTDGNGFVDDVRGWDFDGGDNDPSGSFYHGTFVAGCVAASSNNGQGIAALAGGAVDGQGCLVMALNVGNFSPNGAVLDDAIVYAVDNGARVITLSLTVGATSAIDAACTYAQSNDVFIDCAAGNNGFSVTYPANKPEVMAVASTNRNDVKSGFSNPGAQVEVAAPGESVFSLDLGGGFQTNSGTSFSAPHVAALAGLLFSEDPAATAAGVRAIIRNTADDVGPAGFDTGTGDGRINARNALLALNGGFVFAQALNYGAGTAGFGGETPTISTRNGAPTQGAGAFGITLNDARPASAAYNLLSLGSASVPFEGGTLLVDPFLPSASISVHGTTAGGGALRSVPIPDDPAIVGVQAFSQWIVVDPDGPAGYAFSDGLDLIVGS